MKSKTPLFLMLAIFTVATSLSLLFIFSMRGNLLLTLMLPKLVENYNALLTEGVAVFVVFDYLRNKFSDKKRENR